LEQYEPYKGLHKDIGRLLFIIIFLLLLFLTPIFFFAKLHFNIGFIISGIFLSILLYGYAGLLIWFVFDEYKELKMERETYQKFGKFLMTEQIENEEQKKHILNMLDSSESYFRELRVVAMFDKANLKEIKDERELERASEADVLFAIKIANLRGKIVKNEPLTEKEKHVVNLAVLDKLKRHGYNDML
jgi:hypothetical protein